MWGESGPAAVTARVTRTGQHHRLSPFSSRPPRTALRSAPHIRTAHAGGWCSWPRWDLRTVMCRRLRSRSRPRQRDTQRHTESDTHTERHTETSRHRGTETQRHREREVTHRHRDTERERSPIVASQSGQSMVGPSVQSAISAWGDGKSARSNGAKLKPRAGIVAPRCRRG